MVHDVSFSDDCICTEKLVFTLWNYNPCRQRSLLFALNPVKFHTLEVLTILEYPSMDKYSANSNYSIIVNIARFWLGLGTQDIFGSVSRKLFSDSK